MEALYPASHEGNSNWCMQQKKSIKWTKEENKKFESALAMFDEKAPDRWLMVASMIPGKSVSDVINQYKALVADVTDIEAGLVPDPGYLASSFSLELTDDNRGFDVFRKRGRSCDQERKKGVPWTEEEHRLFLAGLLRYGKGDWRNISRNFVITKTPTQVASHAQKYFLRQQLSAGKDKRRPSIHDITTGHVTNISTADNEKSASTTDKSIRPKTDHKYTAKPQIVLKWNQSNNTAYLQDIVAHQFYQAAIVHQV